MLIEFSVKNFRSIYHQQTLSMVANDDEDLKDSHGIAPPTPNINRIPWLLKAAAIYGANASGKSNLIAAINTMIWMVNYSVIHMTEGQALPFFHPFRFDQKATSQPCEFEIHFIDNNIRYHYGFSFDRQRIQEE